MIYHILITAKVKKLNENYANIQRKYVTHIIAKTMNVGLYLIQRKQLFTRSEVARKSLGADRLFSPQ